MNKMHLPLICMLLALCLLCGCGAAGGSSGTDESTQPETNGAVAEANNAAAELVADIATTQYFADETVPEADIEKILTAGVNAPSAMNGQPWHFSAITDSEVLRQIADDMSGGMSFGGTPSAGVTPPSDGDGSVPEMLDGAEAPEGAEIPDGAAIPEGAGKPEIAQPPANAPSDAPAATGSDNTPTTATLSKAGISDAPLAIVISCTTGSELDAGLACQNMSVEAQLLGYGTKIVSSPTMALNGEKQAEYKELLSIPEDQTVVAILLVGYADTSIDETVDGYTGATVRNPMSDTVAYVKP